jgi:hypothetical protein
MDFWLWNYYQNLLENECLKAMHVHFNGEFRHKCVLGIDLDFRSSEFFLFNCLASFCTCIGKHAPENISNSRFDFLEEVVYNKIGVFEGQYDVVYVGSDLSLILDDIQWQRSVENLCFYLNSGGLLFIPGNFKRTPAVFSPLKIRSFNIWKALVNNYGCSVEKITMDKEIIPFPLAREALIVVKK